MDDDGRCCPQGHLLAEPNLIAYDARRGNRKCLACNRARGKIQSQRRRNVPTEDFRELADSYFAQIMAGTELGRFRVGDRVAVEMRELIKR